MRGPVARRLWHIDIDGLRAPARRRPGDPVPEPHLVPRFGVPDAHRAAQHQLRRQGRVHGLVEDEVHLPGDGHDPDRPLGRRQVAVARSTPRPRCCAAASCSGSSPRARAAATVCCTRGAPARPGWRSRSAARSTRSASSAPTAIQPPGAKAPKPFRSCSITIGRPVRPERYRDRREPHLAWRSMIDEVMFEIREMTGQEYRNHYAGESPDTSDRGRRSSPARPGSPTRCPQRAATASSSAPARCSRSVLRRPARSGRSPRARPASIGDRERTRSSPPTASACTSSRRARGRSCCSSTASRSRGTRGATSCPALAAAGYRAVAIDVRGYGRSSAPPPIDAYRMLRTSPTTSPSCGRSASEQAVVVGHDWGAPIAWNSALLRPDVFRAVAGLSVPFAPAGDTRPTDAFRAMGGDEEFYIEYFQQPGRAEAELEEDVRRWLLGLLLHRVRRRPAVRPARDRRHDPARGEMRDRFAYPDADAGVAHATTTSTCTPASSSAPASPAGSTATATSTATGRTSSAFRGPADRGAGAVHRRRP